MSYTAITNDEIQVKKPVRQELMQKIKDNFDAHETKLSAASGAEIAPNSSFEVDSDADGIPDNWTRYLYPGGSGGFETTNPAHGAKAYKFVHPGGTGNGGGYLESDYIKISGIGAIPYYLSWSMWSSVGGIRNDVTIRFFTLDKTFISENTLYSSTSNPTSIKQFAEWIGYPPTDARYLKIRLIGGESSVDVAGTTYFDWIQFFDSQNPCFFGDELFCLNASEKNTNSITYTRLKQTRLQIGGDIRIKFDIHTGNTARTAYGRIYKNGTAIGTERSTTSTSYVTFSEDIADWLVGDYVELYVKISADDIFAYCRDLNLHREDIPQSGEILE